FIVILRSLSSLSLFFSPTTLPTANSTLSLHDALPICRDAIPAKQQTDEAGLPGAGEANNGNVLAGSDCQVHVPQNRVAGHPILRDRKSTRLNSSHSQISYAVFCLKKKKKKKKIIHHN